MECLKSKISYLFVESDELDVSVNSIVVFAQLPVRDPSKLALGGREVALKIKEIEQFISQDQTFNRILEHYIVQLGRCVNHLGYWN